ncbi:hypothetical protein [Pyxidicoccus caerfyrddinensis]|uniref:hypothetical protein n=1 Tax=Pyxidicoccus caerfyrddinensis TaxID=2709663 RepID=UPI0013DCD1BC|nr:hypothetical protein [Pyxidicoccus caerfyrddinensis]
MTRLLSALTFILLTGCAATPPTARPTAPEATPATASAPEESQAPTSENATPSVEATPAAASAPEESQAPTSENATPSVEVTAAAPSVPGDWQVFTLEDGGFQAAFPSEPEEESSTELDPSMGRLEIRSYVSMTEEKESFLYVTVIKRLKGRFSRPEANDILRGIRDGARVRLNGRLVRDTVVVVKRSGHSCPGRDFEFTSPSGKRMSQRAFVAGDTIYQLIYLRPSEADEPFKKLVGSFSFL